MNKKGFTFVELIVVITIAAILATIGFVVYKDYISSSRDSNRIVQLNDISDGLELLSLKSKLPYPDNAIEISASGSLFAYQGDAGESVIQAIGYDGGGFDPEFDTPFVYMTTSTGNNFQLMGFVKDGSLIGSIKNTYADTIDYSTLYPKVTGDGLGILLEEDTFIPLHLKNIGNSYDIINGSLSVRSYFSDTKVVRSGIDNMYQVYTKSSCKRLLDLGNANGNGEYILEFVSGKKMKVYCDMSTAGGGWTMIARSVAGASGNFGWNESLGTPGINESAPYSMGTNYKELYFSELLFITYQDSKIDRIWSNIGLDNLQLESAQTTEYSIDRSCMNYDSYSNATYCFQYWGKTDLNNMYHLTRGGLGRTGGLYIDGFAGNNTEGIRDSSSAYIFVR